MLDALLHSSTNLDQTSTKTPSVVCHPTTRQPSASNATTSSKRILSNDAYIHHPRKYPKLLTRALKDEFKAECQDIASLDTIPRKQSFNQVDFN